jgi:hypothetical protein
MADLAECVDGLPNICGSEERIRQAIRASRTALENLRTVLRQPVKGEKENEYPLEIVERCPGCMAEQL